MAGAGLALEAAQLAGLAGRARMHLAGHGLPVHVIEIGLALLTRATPKRAGGRVVPAHCAAALVADVARLEVAIARNALQLGIEHAIGAADDRGIAGLAFGHVVQLRLKLAREIQLDEAEARRDERIDQQFAGFGRREKAVLVRNDIAALLDVVHDRRIGRRPADPFGFELLE